MTGWRSVAVKAKLFLIRKSLGWFTSLAIGALAGLNVSSNADQYNADLSAQLLFRSSEIKRWSLFLRGESVMRGIIAAASRASGSAICCEVSGLNSSTCGSGRNDDNIFSTSVAPSVQRPLSMLEMLIKTRGTHGRWAWASVLSFLACRV